MCLCTVSIYSREKGGIEAGGQKCLRVHIRGKKRQTKKIIPLGYWGENLAEKWSEMFALLLDDDFVVVAVVEFNGDESL